jgi:hypothetical protein
MDRTLGVGAGEGADDGCRELGIDVGVVVTEEAKVSLCLWITGLVPWFHFLEK